MTVRAPRPGPAASARRDRRPCLTRTVPLVPAAAAPEPRWRAAVVPALIVAAALGYLGVDLAGLDEPLPGRLPPVARAGLVVLQAIALVPRHRSPRTVFGVVVVLDLAILATSGGALGIGAPAVIVAAYTLVRHERRRVGYPMLAVATAATAAVNAVAMQAADAEPAQIVVISAARVALLYVLPAAAGEYMDNRARLRQALHDRDELLDRERRRQAERQAQAGRTALARELHDIAGHHLSGIIVSAQAASALTRTDPDRARETLRSLQDNARAALADLRRTVGLLRSDDGDRAPGGAPTPAPAIDAIPALIDEARARGQRVEYTRDGEPRPLSPLAETAGYRMVQESLANSARHAPGAACRVHVEYLPDAVRLTVGNDPGPAAAGTAEPDTAAPARQGYGLPGMAERAALVGARLEAGPGPDGGWRNRLTIPAPAERSDP